MPSSSSSDEDLAKFKEAADSSLYNDSLFKKDQAPEDEPVNAPPPSLRFVDQEENNKIHSDLQVTPGYQKHVAKKLSKLLDSQLDSDSSTQSPNTSRNVLQARRRKPVCSSEEDTNSSGVRLFGTSAVFLSSMNIIPPNPRRPKRGRKRVLLRSDSDSSSEDSMENLSAAAVSPDWLLSGEATKGWTNSKGKVERCVVDDSGSLIPIKNGFEALSEVSCSNNNSKEILNLRPEQKKKRKDNKSLPAESELAASFSSVVSIGSDSQGDTSYPQKKHKKEKKRKKQRKEHYSEDATTENTEGEEVVERRKKKHIKGRKKPKYQRVEEKEAEESQMIRDCVPGLLEDDDDGTKLKRIEKRERKKKSKRRKETKEETYLKVKKPSTSSSKKFSRKMINCLSKDLLNLQMNSSQISQD